MDESDNPVDEEERLRYLEFVRGASRHTLMFVFHLYTRAKSRTGPLKMGVVILEKVVGTIMSPIYDKIHEVPLQLLKRFDHRVGVVIDMATRLARNAVSRVHQEGDLRFEKLECSLHERFARVDQCFTNLFDCMNDRWMHINNRVAMIANRNLEGEVIEAQLSDPQFLLGIQPADIWKKGKSIGDGSFNVVCKGVHRQLGALCAIEVIPIPIDRRNFKKIQQEIIILEIVQQHRNIIRYFDCQEIQGVMHIFLEYVHPGPISKFRKRNGAMTGLIIRNFTRQILTGLEHIHRNNIIHRGIRGDNILVDTQGVVKIANFGLATCVKELHSDQEMPYYAAPEIYTGCGNYSTPIDIWSLGCTVIEMFTGTNAWGRNELVQPFFQIMVQNQHPPIPENLSPDGKDFVELCFKENPMERKTAKDLLDHAFVKI